jgi:lysophospholipase L1-like esterase
VTGDAFTSAEGIDTDQAWPRLLETKLAAKLVNKKVEVLNFAITGYGPNQYEAVIQHFAPIYKPDVILIETFVNDFREALFSNQVAQTGIGFEKPAQDSLYSIVRLEQLRRWLQLKLKEPVGQIVLGQPSQEGYSLGNFKAFELGHPVDEANGEEIFTQRLEAIQSTSNELNAKLVIFMVPASIQICTASQLAYYPKGVDLNNRKLYDTDLPQRMMGEMTKALELPFYDLRDLFTRFSPPCPYQSHNMHWTVYGHQIVADYFVNILSKNGYLP